ncbi:ABC transporter transmembrane domain-containing protein [Umboniibacter marinipuniceus]|uniref:ABC transporter family protein n=1 Tax=Umboniibacter marinipuniceus TaxID=569599 RepID=A0A3M0AJ79_9GAMM|nr:ABC transporter transmembrane domain-containing protein [Umboniibacter marinipuniceus]RMA82768.1 ABC transporter family protein [Umboniibacter marinipuniceus]
MKSKHDALVHTQLTRMGKTYIYVVAIISTLLSLVLPLSILVLFEKIIPNNSTDSLIAIYLIIMVAISLDYVLKIAEAKFLNRQGSQAGRKLLTAIYVAFIAADKKLFKRKKYGVYLEDIRAIEQAKEALMSEDIKLAATITSGLVVLLVITGIEPVTGVLLCVGTMVSYLWTHRYKAVRSTTLVDKSVTEGKANTAIIDVVTAPYKVKSSSMEYRSERYLSPIIDSREEKGSRNEALSTLVNSHIGLINQFCLFVVIVVAASRVIDGVVSQGVLAAIVMLVNRYFSFLQQFINFDQSKSLNLKIIQSINDIFALVSPRDEAKYSSEAVDTLVLHGVECQRGKVGFITGGSGSGKTYTQKLLTQEVELVHPEFGKVNGLNIDEFSLDFSREHIIRVTRGGSFIDGTLIDNLTCFNPELHNLCYYLAEAFRIRPIIDDLPKGFYTEVSRTQRLPFSKKTHYLMLIIRATLCEKDILLLDEVDQVFSQAEIEGIARVLANQRRNFFTLIASKQSFSGDLFQTVPVKVNT